MIRMSLVPLQVRICNDCTPGSFCKFLLYILSNFILYHSVKIKLSELELEAEG